MNWATSICNFSDFQKTRAPAILKDFEQIFLIIFFYFSRFFNVLLLHVSSVKIGKLFNMFKRTYENGISVSL